MTVTVHDQAAANLRHRLADELEKTGDLRSARWRAAVETVPRHLFVPAFFRRIEGSMYTQWEPILPARVGTDRWLDLAYTNESWVTQLDGRTLPGDVDCAVPGVPTSSSTLPGLVVLMLEALDVADGMRVMEIGTGTGYSTALLCHRVGDEQVTTVEVDPGVAERADTVLEAIGCGCTLITGDGLLGYPAGAPYDRIIATCSVRRIPYTWVRQTAPGGIILATVSGWLFGSGLAKLHVDGEGTAAGSFLPGRISFMPARPHEPPPITGAIDARTAYPDSQRPARHGPEILGEWTSRFVAQLAASGAQTMTASIGDGPLVTYLIDVHRESFAALTPQPGGTYVVRQGGPVALWDDVEDAVTTWQEAGSPDINQFGIRVSRTEQVVWLDTTAGRRTWALP